MRSPKALVGFLIDALKSFEVFLGNFGPIEVRFNPCLS